jgi:hypothetical protein
MFDCASSCTAAGGGAAAGGAAGAAQAAAGMVTQIIYPKGEPRGRVKYVGTVKNDKPHGQGAPAQAYKNAHATKHSSDTFVQY